MAKKIFAVVLDDSDGPNSKVRARLDKEYANVHHYTDTFSSCRWTAIATQDVATTAGIKGTNRDANGVVFKLNAAYSGYTRKTLWEWLSDVEGS